MKRKSKEGYKKYASNIIVKFIFSLICIYLLYQTFFGITPSSIISNQMNQDKKNRMKDIRNARERHQEILHENENIYIHSNNKYNNKNENENEYEKNENNDVDMKLNQLGVPDESNKYKSSYYHVLMKEVINNQPHHCPDTHYNTIPSSSLYSLVGDTGRNMILFPDKHYIEYELDIHNIDSSYIHVCISNHNYRNDYINNKYDSLATGSTDSEFYAINIVLSSIRGVGGIDEPVGDCDMYLSTTNQYPSPFIQSKPQPTSKSKHEYDITSNNEDNIDHSKNKHDHKNNRVNNNTHSTHEQDLHSLNPSWDWKSNAKGDDSINLKTTMMEFHRLDSNNNNPNNVNNPNNPNSNSPSGNIYKDLYIGINKKYQDNAIVRCKLGVTINPIPKYQLSKSLNLRGKTGQVILPRDIQ